jgi:hypothetical protein
MSLKVCKTRESLAYYHHLTNTIGIEQGELKLTDVILSVQDYIAEDDLTIRAKCKS